MRNLRSNPFIEINLVDPFLRRIPFQGPRGSTSGRNWILWRSAGEPRGRQYPVSVVKVTIEQALPLLPVYMFNDKVMRKS
jgi:hypothetical protein